MAVGDLSAKYRRTYITVQPDAALGPPTLRLAVSEVAGTGGGDVVEAAFEFYSDLPIKVETDNTVSADITDVTTSMAIDELIDRNV